MTSFLCFTIRCLIYCVLFQFWDKVLNSQFADQFPHFISQLPHFLDSFPIRINLESLSLLIGFFFFSICFCIFLGLFPHFLGLFLVFSKSFVDRFPFTKGMQKWIKKKQETEHQTKNFSENQKLTQKMRKKIEKNRKFLQKPNLRVFQKFWNNRKRLNKICFKEVSVFLVQFCVEACPC